MINRKNVIYCTADEDRTKQSFKDECDMNRIVSRINKTGFIPLEAQSSLRRQFFGDVTGVPQSLEHAYAVVQRADQAFAKLPATLRERFGGPSGLLAFVEDPDNLKEAQDLGLLVKNEPTPNSASKPGAPVLPGTAPTNSGPSAKSAPEAAKPGAVQ